MHCCTGNGARTLYYAWDRIVTRSDDEVSVNLLLNRASDWLDVDSYLPVDGKIVLHVKDAPKVAIRMPKWCDPGSVAATVGGRPRQTLVDGRRVRLGYLRKGDRVELRFPVPEQKLHRVIGEIPYKLTLRGSNVVDIDPPGTAYPLFQDQGSGGTALKSRFIPKVRDVVW